VVRYPHHQIRTGQGTPEPRNETEGDSELLDITQPAVSQYISDKRGHGIKFNDETQKLIKDFAKGLVEEKYNQRDIIPHVCEICRKVKTDEILCQLHKEKGKMPTDCDACMSSHLAE